MELTLSLHGSVNAVVAEKVLEALHLHTVVPAANFPADSNKELVSTTMNDTGITLLDDSLSTEASTTHAHVSGRKNLEGAEEHESIWPEDCDPKSDQHSEPEEMKEGMHYMDGITNYALDEWQKKNWQEFGEVEESINIDVLASFFLQLKDGNSDILNEQKPSTFMSTKEADIDGNDRRVQLTTKSEEALRLYFVLLLHNLPLHTVAFEESKKTKKQSKPENTTLRGFFDAYAEIFALSLGDHPTLTKWQDVTTKFLVDACPAHQIFFPVGTCEWP